MAMKQRLHSGSPREQVLFAFVRQVLTVYISEYSGTLTSFLA